MTCLQCGSAHQRGRFCNRCGTKRPTSSPPGGTWALRRPPPRSRAAGETTRPAPPRPSGPDPATIRNLYDTALAREASVGGRPLDRYLSVLLRNPGPAGGQ